MLLTVGKIARQEGLTEGYRLVVNDGEMAGKHFDKRIKRCLFCLKKDNQFSIYICIFSDARELLSDGPQVLLEVKSCNFDEKRGIIALFVGNMDIERK